jgi:DNA excision repair protein ERCC-5
MGGKKLAIDSSIWLYQFQIAMRDKDGRALDNAHILGFLRRICKLLFYGIKPVYTSSSFTLSSIRASLTQCTQVFVFDGGAPTIKKVAISNRKNRKQGAKETAARTAEKLLAAQLRAAAIKQARKDAIEKKEKQTGDLIDENTAYMDEEYGIAPRGAPQRRPRSGAGGTNNDDPSSSPARDNQQHPQDDQLEPLISPVKKKYVHKDAYALPIIEGPISSRGLPSDPRLATDEELRNFIDEMKPDEAEDFDMNSEFFKNLPVETKYEIIGDLRIKSRQSNFKRVEAMKNAPTALDFSRAQIMHLSNRNVLTQKLLTMTDSLSRVMPSGGPATRIAGERNKEYVLIKNDNTAEGGTGYILGVRGGGETASTPVKIDGTTTEESDTDKATTTDEEFEKVEIPSQHHQIYKRSTSPDTLREKRKELAEEAIRLKYSPVKPLRRRGDSPVDDLPALPPQRPLFSSKSANKASSSSSSNRKAAGSTSTTTASSSSFASTASKINARSSSFIPPKTNNNHIEDKSRTSTLMPDNVNDDVWNQITNAVAQAEDADVRLSRDEQDDLARAIEASKQDLNGNLDNGITINSTTDESGDESDVSFDEVETTTTTTTKAQQPQPAKAVSEQQYNWIMPEPHEIMHVQKQKQKQRQEIDAGPEQDISDNASDSDDSVEYVNVDVPSAAPLEQVPTTGMPPAKGAASPSLAAPSSQMTGRTSPSKASGLKNKKPLGLHLDIPAEASILSSSSVDEEETSQRGRTPRPDLTEEQARRDTSPRRVEEKNGIVERDYAQQPRSDSDRDAEHESGKIVAKEVESIPHAPVTISPASTKEAVPSAQPAAPARASLMSRTLSNQQTPGNKRHSSTLASPVQEAAPLLSTVSQADEEALTRGTMSVLDEIRAAMPNEEEGVDKGDLQAILESGESGPLASKLNGHKAAYEQDVEMDVVDDNGKSRQETGSKLTAAAERDSSPEIEYEWSPSPEPAARNRPVDPTLLPLDDPNYIPPDIDFPEPGHELSDLDDEDQEHLQSLNSEKAEYAKFLAELKSRNLDEMEFEVENELTGLQEQNKRDKKMADDITQQMAKDIQVNLM